MKGTIREQKSVLGDKINMIAEMKNWKNEKLKMK